MVYKRYFRNNMGGSTLPVGMVWNYIGGIGIELHRCLQIISCYYANTFNNNVSGDIFRQNINLEVVKTYFGNIKIVESMGRGYGFIPVFYWQPVIFSKEVLAPYEKQVMEVKGQELKDFFNRTYAAINGYHIQLAISHFFNISNIFGKVDKPFFIDFSHLTEAGNEVIASRFTDDIMKLIANSLN